MRIQLDKAVPTVHDRERHDERADQSDYAAGDCRVFRGEPKVTSSERCDKPVEQRDDERDEDGGDEVAFDDITENREKHADYHVIPILSA